MFAYDDMGLLFFTDRVHENFLDEFFQSEFSFLIGGLRVKVPIKLFRFCLSTEVTFCFTLPPIILCRLEFWYILNKSVFIKFVQTSIMTSG